MKIVVVSSVAAPAKINLRLQVVGRRADGYHQLSMINLLLGLADRVAVAASDTDTLAVTVSDRVAQRSGAAELALFSSLEQNILGKTLRLFREKVAAVPPVAITLHKEIPSGAGLGGGSSDAAALWRILQQQFAPTLTEADALRLVTTLGADVPFFLAGSAARVRGIGEVIDPLLEFPLLGDECVVVVPPLHAATPQIFARYRAMHPQLTPRFDAVAEGTDLTRAEALELIANDLWEPLLVELPQMAPLAAALRTLSPELVVGLSGSGSALFCFARTSSELSSSLHQGIAELCGRHHAGCIPTTILRG